MSVAPLRCVVSDDVVLRCVLDAGGWWLQEAEDRLALLPLVAPTRPAGRRLADDAVAV